MLVMPTDQYKHFKEEISKFTSSFWLRTVSFWTLWSASLRAASWISRLSSLDRSFCSSSSYIKEFMFTSILDFIFQDFYSHIHHFSTKYILQFEFKKSVQRRSDGETCVENPTKSKVFRLSRYCKGKTYTWHRLIVILGLVENINVVLLLNIIFQSKYHFLYKMIVFNK